MKRLAILIPFLIACGPFFYQAPPSLAHYPERTPTKGWLEILEASHPRNQESRADLTNDLRKFCQEITKLPKADQLQKTDELITRNRQGHFAISLGNFLLELRELIELEIPPAELQPYLDWRCLRLPPPLPPRPPLRRWNTTQEEFEQEELAYDQKLKAFFASFDEQIDKAPQIIKPFIRTQRAGMYFRSGFLEFAKSDFENIITRFPDHPRSEVARFMLGRVSLQTARSLREKDFPDKAAFEIAHEKRIQSAKALFHQYLDSYPNGRFANDCYGWLGGIARDQNQYGEAIELQIQRLASRPTREVTSSVLRECDQIFTTLFQTAFEEIHPLDGDHIYTSLASSPLLSRLFVSHALDPAAQIHLPLYSGNYSGDRKTIDFLKQRIIAPGPFANHSLARLGAAIVANGTTSDPTSLLILGWSAARSGEHNQALGLFELGLKTEVTDELLHAKAVTLSRLDENVDAARTYEELFTKFPSSSLAQASHFDLAMAHLHSGKSGIALNILLRLQHERRNKHRNKLKIDPLYLHPSLEVPQWIDTIVQFSPIEELESAFNALPPKHPSRQFFRRALCLRALCEERFELARQFTIPDPGQAPHAEKRWRPENYFDLTLARWNEDVAPLIEASQKLAQPNLPPSEQARLHLHIARHWQFHRGQLTLPLHHLTGVTGSETDLLEKLRRNNALYLGLTRDSIDQVLASRDELSHALDHYLSAAKLSKDPESAAPALEGANEALFRLAEFSPDRAALAARNDHSDLSRKLVTRLRTEFPNRPETARAHQFTFLPPILLGNWLPGDRAVWIADMEIAEVFSRFQESTEVKSREIFQALTNLADEEATLPEIKITLTQLKQQFQPLRPHLKPSTLITLVNHLDDLQVVANHPGITAQLFQQYLPIRLSKNKPPLSHDHTKPLAPFIDFLHYARTPRFKVNWDNYLARYPDSPKSEALSLRLIRTQIRKSFPIPHVQPIFFPAAPRSAGYKHLPSHASVKDLAKATQLLAGHRRKFPIGKYQADLNLLEAALAAARNDYPVALDILAKILADPNHPELYQDASLQFSEIALRILDLNERQQLLQAFRNNRIAHVSLEKLVQADTCLARLRPFFPLKN